MNIVKNAKKRYFNYNFDFKNEFSFYTNISYKNAHFKNYLEWKSYVVQKYSNEKYSKDSLINFYHYLKQEHSQYLGKNEVFSNLVLPMFSLIISSIITMIFALVSVINNYNNSINTLTNEEFMDYTRYSVEMIYEALEQNLYSGMLFYFFGTVLLCLFVTMLICFFSVKINKNNEIKSFLEDYMIIIDELINNCSQ